MLEMICFNKLFSQKLLKIINNFDNLFVNQNKRLLCLSVNQLSDGNQELFDVQKYRQKNGIQCFGNSIADPFHSFDCYEWPRILKGRIRHLGYRTPTAVQSQSLPVIFENRDLVSIARSGSGKTLAFVLPALMRTLSAGLDQWPKCLILTPTRELTHQIERVVKQFRFVRSVCLYGGVSYEVQEMFLKKGNPHIVIATPSRLQIILEKNRASLKNVDFVVVDEADHMLGLGFESAFRKIMQLLPERRQTLMFSATWPQSVQTIAEDYLKDYIRVMVSQNKSIESLTVNQNIEQLVRVCKESEKTNNLIECINDLVPTVSGYMKTIIFVRKKTTANQLVRVLKKESYPSRALHSHKKQNEREFVIREFRKGTIPILIATDIASRGLDFKDVRLVINYDFPTKIEDYIHRIGRTGRHEAKGIAISLFTSKNYCHKSSLINILNESNQKVDQKLNDLTSDSEEESNGKQDSGYESSGECETDDSLTENSDSDNSSSDNK